MGAYITYVHTCVKEHKLYSVYENYCISSLLLSNQNVWFQHVQPVSYQSLELATATTPELTIFHGQLQQRPASCYIILTLSSLITL